MTRKGTTEEQEQRDRFTKLRSVLRRAWMRDSERAFAIRDSRIPYIGDNKRRKWSYMCANCFGDEFMQDEVVVDHIIPCGTFLEQKDFATFVPNLFCSRNNLQTLCKECHNKKSKLERGSK